MLFNFNFYFIINQERVFFFFLEAVKSTTTVKERDREQTCLLNSRNRDVSINPILYIQLESVL